MRFRPLLLLGLALLAAVPYLGTLGDGFVFDDQVVIAKNPIVKDFDWQGIFGRPYWFASSAAAIYRPLTTLGFAANWAMGGGSPRPFIVTNIVLHALATVLVFSLLRRLFPGRESTAGWIAALFAVHPLHVEAVAGIVGRAEVLTAVLTLLSYRLWLDAEERPSFRRAIVPPLLWCAALLAKESAVMLPVLLLLHRRGWLPGTPRAGLRRSDAAWLLAFLAVLFLRVHALGGIHAPATDGTDNPLTRVGPFARFLGAGGVLARQLWQALTGLKLSADYSYAAILPGPRLFLAGAITLAAAITVTVLLFRKARGSMAAWGIAFFLVFWFVTSNLIVPVGTAQADRLFYLPLLGLLAFAVAPVYRLRPLAARPLLLHGLFAVLIVAAGARSIDRARVWKNERTLYESALVDEPRSVKARWNLAVVLLQEDGAKYAPRVLKILEPVAKWTPNHPDYLFREAVAFMFLDRNQEADSLFRAALRAGTKDSADARVELGNLALARRDGEAALREFDAVARMNELGEHVSIGRASALSILGRFRESADAWAPVNAQMPDSIPVRVALAFNLREAGDPERSIAVLEDGLRRRRDQRLFNELAQSYLAGRRYEDAALLRPNVTDPDVIESIDRALPKKTR